MAEALVAKMTKMKEKADQTIPLPPLQPNSPKEIASYTDLDLALRMHPELASEGGNLLNARALSRLVEGMRAFQKVHLGPESKNAINQKWPIVKIPDFIFRSRTATGPLYSLLLSTYKYKQQSGMNPNRPFDFTSPKRYEENIAMMQKIEQDLVEEGVLKRPVVYFDDTIPKKMQTELGKIVKRFGGRIVGKKDALMALSKEKQLNDAKADGSAAAAGENQGNIENLPTHIVAWDEEEHDAKEILQEEEMIATGEKPMEKLYLRTMIIVDPKKEAASNRSSIVESHLPDSKKKGGKVKGKNAPPPLEHPMALVHWWYWPSSYDDWMLASEVAGEGEIGLPSPPNNGPWVVGCKFIRDVAKWNEWGLEVDYSIADYEKKVSLYKNFAKEQAKAAKEAAKKKKESESKKEKEKASLKIQLPISAVIKDRRDGTGMNPRQILSGVYMEGNRSVKMKRTVYDGALRVPANTVELLKGALNNVDPSYGEKINPQNAQYTLPMVGSVKRPSEDPSMFSQIIVTELSAGMSGDTLTKNRIIQNEVILGDNVVSIRGGGESTDVEMKDESATVANKPEASDSTKAETEPSSAATNTETKSQGDSTNTATATPTPTVTKSQGDSTNTATAAPTVTKSQGESTNTATATPTVTKSQGDSTNTATTTATPTATKSQDDSINTTTTTATATAKSETTKTPEPNPTVKPQESDAQLKPLVKLSDKAPSESTSKEPLTGDQEQTIKFPEFYNQEKASDFEKTMLPEWFNNSADHRSPQTYVTTREKIINLARKNTTKYVTSTAVRRSVIGDAGSLYRLHQFLITWGFINAGTIGDTAPTKVEMTKQGQTYLNNANAIPTYNWTKDKKKLLAKAVVNHISRKRRREEDSEMAAVVDWSAVAEVVGGGVTSNECQQKFLSLDLHQEKTESSNVGIVKPDPEESKQSSATTKSMKANISREMIRDDVISELIQGVKPEVAEATINAALQSTNDDLEATQKASLLGMITSKALNEARKEEDATSHILQEILNNRMLKLESRLTLLDDIEGILDTERMALELERRDLYTARCRHWFGGS